MVTIAHTLQFLTPFTTTARPNRTSFSSVCCFSARHGGRSGGDSTGDGPRRFRFDDELRASGADKDANFWVGADSRQRIWWSDDDSVSWGNDYDDEDDDFEGFGSVDSSISFSWIFKVLQSFGWMIPAVIISMLFRTGTGTGTGTGTDSIIMALALPLAQTALSLVIETFSRTSSDRPRPKSRTKKRPRAKTEARTRVQEQNTNNENAVRGYDSWAPSNDASNEKEMRSKQRFGGWDELVNTRAAYDTPKTTPDWDRKQWSESKKRRRVSKKQKPPLLLRQLIAVFPFLGSWTKLL